jgi:hypothetical protein
LARNCIDISTANVRELCVLPEKADELSPAFMFQLTATKLLVQIVNEKIDPVQLAMRELKNR